MTLKLKSADITKTKTELNLPMCWQSPKEEDSNHHFQLASSSLMALA